MHTIGNNFGRLVVDQARLAWHKCAIDRRCFIVSHAFTTYVTGTNRVFSQRERAVGGSSGTFMFPERNGLPVVFSLAAGNVINRTWDVLLAFRYIFFVSFVS